MPSSVNASSSRLAPSMIGTSCRISWMLTTSGAIRALMPRMNSTLKMLLPTTLPMAMSVLPSSTAPTLTATSGALVPKATMVSPTTSGLMPNDRASLDAPRTSTLAPMTSRIRPPRNMSMFMIGHYSDKYRPPQPVPDGPALGGAVSGGAAWWHSSRRRGVLSTQACPSQRRLQPSHRARATALPFMRPPAGVARDRSRHPGGATSQ